MQATDILMQEHEVILRVIGALEIQTNRLAAENPGHALCLSDSWGDGGCPWFLTEWAILWILLRYLLSTGRHMVWWR